MAKLFDKNSDIIGAHLKHSYANKKLDKATTTEYFPVVQIKDNRQVKRNCFINWTSLYPLGIE
jgi:hypothetical protein